MGKQEIIRDEKGRVKKGSKALNPKGRVGPNKFTKDMTTMVTEALNRAGLTVQSEDTSLSDLEPGVAYLAHQATRRPDLFVPLLRQMMPSKVDMEVKIMTENMVEVMHKRRDQLAQMRQLHLSSIEDAEVLDGTETD